MTSPLKYQTNTTSIVGSWDTWQGKTILSPTVTSILDGGIVMTVLSVEKRLCFKGLENANTYFLMYCYYFTEKKKNSIWFNMKKILPFFKHYKQMNHLHPPHSQIWGIRAEEGQEDVKWKRLGDLVRSSNLGTLKGCFVDIFIEAVLLALGKASQHCSTDHKVHEIPCYGGTMSTWGKGDSSFLTFFLFL